jgi:hypothetical protein
MPRRERTIASDTREGCTPAAKANASSGSVRPASAIRLGLGGPGLAADTAVLSG